MRARSLRCLSWAGAKAIDASASLWFGTVAAAMVLAGALARPSRWLLVGLWALADVATFSTLYLWWSSSDVTGLLMVGIMLPVIPIVGCTPLLLLAGSWWRSTRERRES